MKKVLSILLILCVAASLFASIGLTVKGGAGFDYLDQKTVKREEAPHAYNRFSFTALELQAGIQYDVSSKLFVFTDADFVFPHDSYAKIGDDNSESDWFLLSVPGTINGNYEKSSFLSLSTGVGYRLDLNVVKLAVGGGVSYSSYKVIFKDSGAGNHYEITYRDKCIGVTGLIEAKYMLSANVGLTVTAKPQMNIYNLFSIDVMNNNEADPSSIYNLKQIKGIALGYAIPVVVGVSYTF